MPTEYKLQSCAALHFHLSFSVFSRSQLFSRAVVYLAAKCDKIKVQQSCFWLNWPLRCRPLKWRESTASVACTRIWKNISIITTTWRQVRQDSHFAIYLLWRGPNYCQTSEDEADDAPTCTKSDSNVLMSSLLYVKVFVTRAFPMLCTLSPISYNSQVVAIDSTAIVWDKWCHMSSDKIYIINDY